jgi:hypothetical protein
VAITDATASWVCMGVRQGQPGSGDWPAVAEAASRKPARHPATCQPCLAQPSHRTRTMNCRKLMEGVKGARRRHARFGGSN